MYNNRVFKPVPVDDKKQTINNENIADALQALKLGLERLRQELRQLKGGR